MITLSAVKREMGNYRHVKRAHFRFGKTHFPSLNSHTAPIKTANRDFLKAFSYCFCCCFINRGFIVDRHSKTRSVSRGKELLFLWHSWRTRWTPPTNPTVVAWHGGHLEVSFTGFLTIHANLRCFQLPCKNYVTVFPSLKVQFISRAEDQ